MYKKFQLIKYQLEIFVAIEIFWSKWICKNFAFLHETKEIYRYEFVISSFVNCIPGINTCIDNTMLEIKYFLLIRICVNVISLS